MGRKIEGVESHHIRNIIPYLGEGVFRQVDLRGSLQGNTLIPPERGTGRYSLVRARERSKFHNGVNFYDPRESESTRTRKKDRENHNRKLHKQQAR